MGLIIGMDEAGYGPNLGPLVVTLSAWEVPGDPRRFDFWQAFDGVLTQQPADGDLRLHVADSKAVYSPAKGLQQLERSVRCLLRLFDMQPASFADFCRAVGGARNGQLHEEPWFADADLPLPDVDRSDDVDATATAWKSCCVDRGVRPRALRSDLVLGKRFNGLVRQNGSKGLALSRISLELLREIWDPGSDAETLIVADKHGGRNRYDLLLGEILDGQMVFRLEEGRALSRYRTGRSEVRFQTRGESHLPVAAASMVSKYLRELSMTLFNRYWSSRLPGLKPTAGYPTDARRFKQEIAAVQTEMGIPDEMLWRSR